MNYGRQILLNPSTEYTGGLVSPAANPQGGIFGAQGYGGGIFDGSSPISGLGKTSHAKSGVGQTSGCPDEPGPTASTTLKTTWTNAKNEMGCPYRVGARWWFGRSPNLYGCPVAGLKVDEVVVGEGTFGGMLTENHCYLEDFAPSLLESQQQAPSAPAPSAPSAPSGTYPWMEHSDGTYSIQVSANVDFTMLGMPKISEDGKLGPGTCAALQWLVNSGQSPGTFVPGTCQTFGTYPPAAGGGGGAPTPTPPAPDNGAAYRPARAGMGTGGMLMIGAAVAGLGIYAWTRAKK